MIGCVIRVAIHLRHRYNSGRGLFGLAFFVITLSASGGQVSEIPISSSLTLPVPSGEWRVHGKHEVSLCTGGLESKWAGCRGGAKAVVLVNSEKDAEVAAVVIRYSQLSQGIWRFPAGCTDTANESFTREDTSTTLSCSSTQGIYDFNSLLFGQDRYWSPISSSIESLPQDIQKLDKIHFFIRGVGKPIVLVDLFIRRPESFDRKVIYSRGDWKRYTQLWTDIYRKALVESLLWNKKIYAESDLKFSFGNSQQVLVGAPAFKAEDWQSGAENLTVRELYKSLALAERIAGKNSAQWQNIAKQLVALGEAVTIETTSSADPQDDARQSTSANASTSFRPADLAKLERERKEAERLAQEAAEREQVAKAQAEEQRRRLAEIARQEEELRRQEATRAEAERLAKEAANKERMAKEEAERQRRAEAESIKAQLQRLQASLAKLNEQSTSSRSQPVAVKQAPRHALVIGNAGYTSVGALGNAVTDAQAFAKALSGFGFQVALHTDIKETQFKQAVLDFKNQVETGSEVVFYYAGHGVQFGTANYLLPVDVGAESSEGVKDDSVELQQILNAISEKQLKFTLAVVDACRDNPFAVAAASPNGRSLADNPKMKAILESKGVTPTNTAAIGQMVIYSASAGQQALDSLGPNDRNPNGLFTRVFLEKMSQPGMPVDRVLRLVKKDVVRLAKSVNHDQVPALYDQTIGEFFFRP